jgi:hypothetical protein
LKRRKQPHAASWWSWNDPRRGSRAHRKRHAGRGEPSSHVLRDCCAETSAGTIDVSLQLTAIAGQGAGHVLLDRQPARFVPKDPADGGRAAEAMPESRPALAQRVVLTRRDSFGPSAPVLRLGSRRPAQSRVMMPRWRPGVARPGISSAGRFGEGLRDDDPRGSLDQGEV